MSSCSKMFVESYKSLQHRKDGSDAVMFQDGHNQGSNSTYGDDEKDPRQHQTECDRPNYAQKPLQPQGQKGKGQKISQKQNLLQHQLQRNQQQRNGQAHHVDIEGKNAILASKGAKLSVYDSISSLCFFGRSQMIDTSSNAHGGNDRVENTGGQQQQQDNSNALGGGTPNSNAQPQADVQIVDGVPRIMGGNKRSLFIGINYTGTNKALQSCHNDVEKIKKLVVELYGFPTDTEHMRVLVDTEENKEKNDLSKLPLRSSIEAAMKWLVGGAQSGDSLFLHYSGHATRVKDFNGDEADSKDSAIVPLDSRENGLILDDEIYDIMVSKLPAGVKLTAIFDCCYSGTIMDLAFQYLPDGQVKNDPRVVVKNSKGAEETKPVTKRWKNLASDVTNNSKNVPSTKCAEHENSSRLKTSVADVIMYSGCMDSQTSAVLFFGEKAGAMSWAFNKILRANPMQSYIELLKNISDLLHKAYTQTPQLSSGRELDVHQLFAI